jgi:hypothetical protein
MIRKFYAVTILALTLFINVCAQKQTSLLASDNIIVAEQTERLTTEANEVSVFPSPTFGPVTIIIPQGETVIRFSIYDLLGNVMNMQGEPNQKGKYTLNLDGLKPGYYFIKVQTDKQLVTKRITLTD